MRLRVAVLSAVLGVAGLAVAQEHHHDFDPNEKLGTVKFPVSCQESVQKPFVRGVALLHSFWYDQAEKEFQQIEQQDPKCGMAYWGEAMTLFHQLWDRPDKDKLKRGWELLEKGKKAGTGTPREADYLNALVDFYRDYDKAKFETRVAAYSNAMEKLYAKYPDDHEAGAFYGLSLLAAAPPHDATFANQKKAVAVLDKLFEVEPSHPGIPHYIIHSCDSPQLASLGLNAARKYASIAPSAPHAVHMPSHIFARLGLWQESIRSNLGSIAAAEKTGARGHELHAMDFLHYAYLQVGEDAKARELDERIEAHGGMEGHDMHEYQNYARVQFPATYALETRNWKDAIAFEAPAGVEAFNRAVTDWAHGVAAGHLRDAATAEKALKHYDEMVEATKKSEDAYVADSMGTDRDEIAAWLAFAQNKNEEAVALMGKVAERQDAEGKREVALPAREMLADMLLEMNQPKLALAEYEKSLKVDPNRFNGLYGAARAAEAAGQPEVAQKYYAQIVENCKGAGSERPELARARAQAKAMPAGN